MGILRPIVEFFGAIVGVDPDDWPKGDEDALRRCADRYDAIATHLRGQLGQTALQTAGSLAAAWNGEGGRALAQQLTSYVTSEEYGGIEAIAKNAETVAQYLRDQADTIARTKVMIIAQVVIGLLMFAYPAGRLISLAFKKKLIGMLKDFIARRAKQTLAKGSAEAAARKAKLGAFAKIKPLLPGATIGGGGAVLFGLGPNTAAQLYGLGTGQDGRGEFDDKGNYQHEEGWNWDETSTYAKITAWAIPIAAVTGAGAAGLGRVAVSKIGALNTEAWSWAGRRVAGAAAMATSLPAADKIVTGHNPTAESILRAAVMGAAMPSHPFKPLVDAFRPHQPDVTPVEPLKPVEVREHTTIDGGVDPLPPPDPPGVAVKPESLTATAPEAGTNTRTAEQAAQRSTAEPVQGVMQQGAAGTTAQASARSADAGASARGSVKAPTVDGGTPAAKPAATHVPGESSSRPPTGKPEPTDTAGNRASVGEGKATGAGRDQAEAQVAAKQPGPRAENVEHRSTDTGRRGSRVEESGQRIPERDADAGRSGGPHDDAAGHRSDPVNRDGEAGSRSAERQPPAVAAEKRIADAQQHLETAQQRVKTDEASHLRAVEEFGESSQQGRDRARRLALSEAVARKAEEALAAEREYQVAVRDRDALPGEQAKRHADQTAKDLKAAERAVERQQKVVDKADGKLTKAVERESRQHATEEAARVETRQRELDDARRQLAELEAQQAAAKHADVLAHEQAGAARTAAERAQDAWFEAEAKRLTRMAAELDRALARLNPKQLQQLFNGKLAGWEHFAPAEYRFLAIHEMIHRTTEGWGYALKWTQIKTDLVVRAELLADMYTGEGKTAVGVLALGMVAAEHKAVHFMTSSRTLADGNHSQFRKVLEPLGVEVRKVDPQRPEAKPKGPTVYVGDVASFGWSMGRGHRVPGEHVIIDEIDAVAIELAKQVYTHSAGAAGRASGRTTAEVQLARRALDSGKFDHADFGLAEHRSTPELTPAGRQKLAAFLGKEVSGRRFGQLVGRLEAEAQARWVLTEGRDYIRAKINDADRILIVNRHTGEPLIDPTTLLEQRWTSVAQALEARHGLELRADPTHTNQVTTQRLLKSYEHISGMSGTAKLAEQAIRDLYGPDQIGRAVETVPFNERKLVVRTEQHFETAEAKWRAIVEQTVADLAKNGDPRNGGPQAIITEHNDEVVLVQKLLKEQLEKAGLDGGPEIQIVNAEQMAKFIGEGTFNESMAAIWEKAGKPGTITVGNKVLGRGIDIVPDAATFGAGKVPEAGARVYTIKGSGREAVDGGLAVRVGFRDADSPRGTAQAINRAGRQGAPGEATIYTSHQDQLFRNRPEALEAALVYRDSTATATRDSALRTYTAAAIAHAQATAAHAHSAPDQVDQTSEALRRAGEALHRAEEQLQFGAHWEYETKIVAAQSQAEQTGIQGIQARESQENELPALAPDQPDQTESPGRTGSPDQVAHTVLPERDPAESSEQPALDNAALSPSSSAVLGDRMPLLDEGRVRAAGITRIEAISPAPDADVRRYVVTLGDRGSFVLNAVRDRFFAPGTAELNDAFGAFHDIELKFADSAEAIHAPVTDQLVLAAEQFAQRKPAEGDLVIARSRQAMDDLRTPWPATALVDRVHRLGGDLYLVLLRNGLAIEAVVTAARTDTTTAYSADLGRGRINLPAGTSAPEVSGVLRQEIETLGRQASSALLRTSPRDLHSFIRTGEPPVSHRKAPATGPGGTFRMLFRGGRQLVVEAELGDVPADHPYLVTIDAAFETATIRTSPELDDGQRTRALDAAYTALKTTELGSYNDEALRARPEAPPANFVDLGELKDLPPKLSSAGEIGSVATLGGHSGAYLIEGPGGVEWVVKLYPDSTRHRGQAMAELEGLSAAALTGYGPTPYGLIRATVNQQSYVGVAMARVDGGFINPRPGVPSAVEEAARWRAAVTFDTVRQFDQYLQRLHERGYYHRFDLQYFVDGKGNLRPIDLEFVTKLPEDPAARQAAIDNSRLTIDGVRNQLVEAATERVEGLAAEVRAELRVSESVEVRVVPDMAALQAVGLAPGEPVAGVYSNESGRHVVYLVAEHLESRQQVDETIHHELQHGGLRVLPRADHDRVLGWLLDRYDDARVAPYFGELTPAQLLLLDRNRSGADLDPEELAQIRELAEHAYIEFALTVPQSGPVRTLWHGFLSNVLGPALWKSRVWPRAVGLALLHDTARRIAVAMQTGEAPRQGADADPHYRAAGPSRNREPHRGRAGLTQRLQHVVTGLPSIRGELMTAPSGVVSAVVLAQSGQVGLVAAVLAGTALAWPAQALANRYAGAVDRRAKSDWRGYRRELEDRATSRRRMDIAESVPTPYRQAGKVIPPRAPLAPGDLAVPRPTAAWWTFPLRNAVPVAMVAVPLAIVVPPVAVGAVIGLAAAAVGTAQYGLHRWQVRLDDVRRAGEFGERSARQLVSDVGVGSESRVEGTQSAELRRLLDELTRLNGERDRLQRLLDDRNNRDIAQLAETLIAISDALSQYAAALQRHGLDPHVRLSGPNGSPASDSVLHQDPLHARNLTDLTWAPGRHHKPGVDAESAALIAAKINQATANRYGPISVNAIQAKAETGRRLIDIAADLVYELERRHAPSWMARGTIHARALRAKVDFYRTLTADHARAVPARLTWLAQTGQQSTIPHTDGQAKNATSPAVPGPVQRLRSKALADEAEAIVERIREHGPSVELTVRLDAQLAALGPVIDGVRGRLEAKRASAKAADAVVAAAPAVVAAEEEAADEGRHARLRTAKQSAAKAVVTRDRHRQVAAEYEEALRRLQAAEAGYQAMQADLSSPDLLVHAAEAAEQVSGYLATMARIAPPDLTIATGMPTDWLPHLTALIDRINELLVAQGIDERFTAATLQPLLLAEFGQLAGGEGAVLRVGQRSVGELRIKLTATELTEVLNPQTEASETMIGVLPQGGRWLSTSATPKVEGGGGFDLAKALVRLAPAGSVLHQLGKALKLKLSASHSRTRTVTANAAEYALGGGVEDNRDESVLFGGPASWELTVRTGRSSWIGKEIVDTGYPQDQPELQLHIAHSYTVPATTRTAQLDPTERDEKLPKHVVSAISGLEALSDEVQKLVGARLTMAVRDQIRNAITSDLPGELRESTGAGLIRPLVVDGRVAGHLELRSTIEAVELVGAASEEHWQEALRVGFSAASGSQSFGRGLSISAEAGIAGLSGHDLFGSGVTINPPSAGVGRSVGRSGSQSAGGLAIHVGVLRFTGPTQGYRTSIRHEVTVVWGNKVLDVVEESSEALLRFKANEAYRYGLAVDEKVLRKDEHGAPLLVNGRQSIDGDPRPDAQVPGRKLDLPAWAGVESQQLRGAGPWAVQDVTGGDEALRDVMKYLSTKGYLPTLDANGVPDLSKPADDPVEWHGQLANLNEVRAQFSALRLETGYDIAAQTGLQLTVVKTRLGHAAESLTLRIDIAQNFKAEPLGVTTSESVVILNIGSNTAGRSGGRSKAIGLAASAGIEGQGSPASGLAKAGFAANWTRRGRSVGWSSGSTVNQVTLVESTSPVAVFRIPHKLTVTALIDGMEHEVHRGTPGTGARVSMDSDFLPYDDKSPASTPYLAIEGVVKSGILDRGILLGLSVRDLQRALPPEIRTDPTALRHVAAFLNPRNLIAHPEWTQTPYRTRTVVRGGAVPRAAGVSVTGKIRDAQFVAVTDGVSGDINFSMGSHGSEGSTSSGHGFSGSVGGAGAGPSAAAGDVSASKSGNVSRSRSNLQIWGGERLTIEVGRHYVFLAPVDFTLAVTDSAIVGNLHGTEEEPSSSGGMALFQLPERDALRFYATDELNLPLHQVADVVERFVNDKLSMDRRTLTAVFRRYYAERKAAGELAPALSSKHTEQLLATELAQAVGLQSAGKRMMEALEQAKQAVSTAQEVSLAEYHQKTMGDSLVESLELFDERGPVRLLASVTDLVSKVLVGPIDADPVLMDSLYVDLAGKRGWGRLDDMLDPGAFLRSYLSTPVGGDTQQKITVRLKMGFGKTAAQSLGETTEAIGLVQDYGYSEETRAEWRGQSIGASGKHATGHGGSASLGTDRSSGVRSAIGKQLTEIKRKGNFGALARIQRELTLEIEVFAEPAETDGPLRRGLETALRRGAGKLGERRTASVVLSGRLVQLIPAAMVSHDILEPLPDGPVDRRTLTLPSNYVVEGTVPFGRGRPEGDELVTVLRKELASPRLLNPVGVQLHQVDLQNMFSASARNAMFPMMATPEGHAFDPLPVPGHARKVVQITVRADVFDVRLVAGATKNTEIGQVNRIQHTTSTAVSVGRLLPLAGGLSTGGDETSLLQTAGLNGSVSVGEQVSDRVSDTSGVRRERSRFEAGADSVIVRVRVSYDVRLEQKRLLKDGGERVVHTVDRPRAATGEAYLTMFRHQYDAMLAQLEPGSSVVRPEPQFPTEERPRPGQSHPTTAQPQQTTGPSMPPVLPAGFDGGSGNAAALGRMATTEGRTVYRAAEVEQSLQGLLAGDLIEHVEFARVAGLERIEPVGPMAWRVWREGRSHDVVFRVGPLADHAMAGFAPTEGRAGTTVTVSPLLIGAAEVLSAVGHELRELSELPGHVLREVGELPAAGVDVFVPGPARLDGVLPSAHDRGRETQLALLGWAADRESGPAAGVRADLALLDAVTHLGLLPGTEGADRRLAMLDPSVAARIRSWMSRVTDDADQISDPVMPVAGLEQMATAVGSSLDALRLSPAADPAGTAMQEAVAALTAAFLAEQDQRPLAIDYAVDRLLATRSLSDRLDQTAVTSLERAMDIGLGPGEEATARAADDAAAVLSLDLLASSARDRSASARWIHLVVTAAAQVWSTDEPARAEGTAAETARQIVSLWSGERTMTEAASLLVWASSALAATESDPALSTLRAVLAAAPAVGLGAAGRVAAEAFDSVATWYGDSADLARQQSTRAITEAMLSWMGDGPQVQQIQAELASATSGWFSPVTDATQRALDTFQTYLLGKNGPDCDSLRMRAGHALQHLLLIGDQDDIQTPAQEALDALRATAPAAELVEAVLRIRAADYARSARMLAKAAVYIAIDEQRPDTALRAIEVVQDERTNWTTTFPADAPDNVQAAQLDPTPAVPAGTESLPATEAPRARKVAGWAGEWLRESTSSNVEEVVLGADPGPGAERFRLKLSGQSFVVTLRLGPLPEGVYSRVGFEPGSLDPVITVSDRLSNELDRRYAARCGWLELAATAALVNTVAVDGGRVRRGVPEPGEGNAPVKALLWATSPMDQEIISDALRLEAELVLRVFLRIRMGKVGEREYEFSLRLAAQVVEATLIEQDLRWRRFRYR